MTRAEYEADLKNRGKKRRKRRKSKHSFVGPVLLVLVLLTCLALCLVFFFRVDTVKVRETDLAAKEDIIRASGIQTGANLLMLDEEKAASGIYSLNPEIDSCTVKKIYPSTVEIQLVRGTPAYYAEGKKGYYTISTRNRILGVSAKPEASLPILRGLPEQLLHVGDFLSADEPRYSLAVQTAKSLLNAGMPDYDLIDVTELYHVNVLYDGHVRLVLGNESNLDVKAGSIYKTWKADFKPGEFGIIDGSIELHKTSVRKGEEHIAFFDRTEKPSEPVSGENESASETSGEEESQQSDPSEPNHADASGTSEGE